MLLHYNGLGTLIQKSFRIGADGLSRFSRWSFRIVRIVCTIKVLAQVLLFFAHVHKRALCIFFVAFFRVEELTDSWLGGSTVLAAIDHKITLTFDLKLEVLALITIYFQMTS